MNKDTANRPRVYKASMRWMYALVYDGSVNEYMQQT